MSIRRTLNIILWSVLGYLFTAPVVSNSAQAQASQEHAIKVKDSRLQIRLYKHASPVMLDQFVVKYSLFDIPLQQFSTSRTKDSLVKIGWSIDKDDKDYFEISKPIESLDFLHHPAAELLFSEQHASFATLFKEPNNLRQAGVNQFRQQGAVIFRGTKTIFCYKGNLKARRVNLAGSFNQWSTSVTPLLKTDTGWVTTIELQPGKVLYKFIVDDSWITDPTNRQKENDGNGNTNSVLFVPNTTILLKEFANARSVFVAGSFNNWDPNQLALQKTSGGWMLPMYLAEGTYTYRFIVDGHWMTDPANSQSFPNEFNDYNSVLYVGKKQLVRLEGYQSATSIALTGNFNNWRTFELPMKKINGGWEIDYAFGSGNFEYQFIIDGKWISKAATIKDNNVIVSNENPYFVVNPNYTFRFRGFGDARIIKLSGDFNNWSETSFLMQREGDEWVLPVYLAPGKHLYKLIVDGEWLLDPTNEEWEQNEYGTGNSILWFIPNALG